jgi:hypothetical protein
MRSIAACISCCSLSSASVDVAETVVVASVVVGVATAIEGDASAETLVVGLAGVVEASTTGDEEAVASDVVASLDDAVTTGEELATLSEVVATPSETGVVVVLEEAAVS